MGTPNTYYFKCPNCGGGMDIQGPGDMHTVALSGACECELHTIEKAEEICKKCSLVIQLVPGKALKETLVLTPTVKEP